MTKTKPPEKQRLYFAGTLAAVLGKSEDTIYWWAKKLKLGEKQLGRLVFSAADYKAIADAINSSKRGWPKGKSREGQGSGRQWSPEQRKKYARTIERRKKAAAK